MADIFIYNLTTIGSIDAANDWMIIEDTSVGETKKAAPGQLPISTATQAALDTKVDENAPIAAATKAKITYDAKGLVTAGADLSASDMPTGINAANISSGLISNAEFDYLNGLSDNIQTQLNGKQQSLTLTTTGTSGAATLVGGTLNIPQYSGGGASGVSQIVAGTNVTISPVGGTGVVTINATGGGGGGGGTVTNVSALTLGTSGTDLSSTVANSTTTPVITLNVPNASASNRGALTSTDWSTFNGKQANLVSGTNIKTVNSTSLLGSGNVDVQATITGAATTITTSDLTVSRALTSNASGKVAVSATTDTELGYVSGVTSAIQTQIDSKQATLVSGTNIKTINSTSLLGSGDITISASPSGVAGAIQFSDGSAFASDAANLFWDDTNNRLGIGTNTPSATAHIKGSGSSSATTSLLVQNSAGTAALTVKDDLISSFAKGIEVTPSTNYGLNAGYVTQSANSFLVMREGSTTGYKIAIGTDGTGSTIFYNNQTNASFVSGEISLTIVGATKNVLIGTTTDVASSLMTLASTTKGFLPPRMTTTQRDAITSPATGLKIYNTTLGTTDTYDGTTWQRFGQQTLIKGSGSTSATTSLLVQNSAGTNALQIRDDRVTNFEVPVSINGWNIISSDAKIGITPYSSGLGTLFNSTTPNGASYLPCTFWISNFFIEGSGGTQIGNSTGSINASAKLQVDSTTKGFLPPRMTNPQKNAIATPAAGLVVYDSTTNKLCCYDGSTWNDLF
jgi:hypothetical protein